jgi:hypothetical protein
VIVVDRLSRVSGAVIAPPRSAIDIVAWALWDRMALGYWLLPWLRAFLSQMSPSS